MARPPTSDVTAPRRQFRTAHDRRLDRRRRDLDASDEDLFPDHGNLASLMASVLAALERTLTHYAAILTPGPLETVLLKLLERHRAKHDLKTKGLVENLHSLTPEQAEPPKLPKLPPETWEARDLNKRENPVQFLKRVYSPWMVDGFRMRQIRPLDSALYKACSVWVHRHPEDRIDEPPPPKESMAHIIEQLSQHLSDQDLRRLGYAIDAHCRKKAKTCTPS